jgi:hypothetical protein
MSYERYDIEGYPSLLLLNFLRLAIKWWQMGELVRWERHYWNIIQGVTEQGMQIWKFIVTKRTVISQHSFLQAFLNTSRFYKCSIWLPLVMRHTSRRYYNFYHSLSKKLASTRAMVSTVLSQIYWRSTGMGGMYILSFTNPQNERPWVSDWVIRVAMECSHHDLSILPWTSTTWSGFCDPQMIRLWRFTFLDKWKVASSLKTILSENKLYSFRQFSISVRKFLRCGRSLGFNSCSSWNLYGRKDSLLRSTLHTVMWETSPSSLLDRRTWTKHSQKDG